jgi:hypothetical protein
VTPSLPQTPEAIVKYRCDYCGGHLGLIVDRYYRMRFCCKAHMSAYKQRLTMETRAKIRQLELLTPIQSRYEAQHGGAEAKVIPHPQLTVRLAELFE